MMETNSMVRPTNNNIKPTSQRRPQQRQTEHQLPTISVSKDAIRNSCQDSRNKFQCALPSTNEGQLGLHRVIFAYCVAILSWRAIRMELVANDSLQDLDKGY